MQKKIIILFLLMNQLVWSQIGYDGNWKITNVKTNHILKGPSEEFDVPTYLKGKVIKIDKNMIDLSNIENKVFLSSIIENKSSNFNIGTTITLNAYKDNPKNQFPGDELSEVFVNEKIENFKIGTSFLKILDLNLNKVTAYKLYGKNNFKSYLLLFASPKMDELILFSYNEEYIFFLKKQ